MRQRFDRRSPPIAIASAPPRIVTTSTYSSSTESSTVPMCRGRQPKELFWDAWHLNAEGHGLFADALAGWIATMTE